MVLVDTSIWIEFFRGRDEAVVSDLSDLLDKDQVLLAAPIRIELLNGARKSEFPKLRRVLDALPTIFPDDGTWSRIEGWTESIVNKGRRFGFADLLIASLAKDAEARIWSLDADFEAMRILGLIS